MAVENKEAEAAKPSAVELKAALAACGIDRGQLQTQMEEILKRMWTESIYVVEEALGKTHPGNRPLFEAYRSRLLNHGNKLRRELPTILQDYLIHQVFVRESVTHVTPRSGDPWGLPLGVKMPTSMQIKH